MQEYAKHMLSKIEQSLKESPRGGMLVRNKNILDEK